MKSPEIMRISPLATRSCHDELLLVDQALLDRKARDAAASVRKREIHVLHAGDEDTLHRMLNAIQPGSYIRPHRHLNPPKAETIVILQGSLGYVPFEGDGTPVEGRFILLDAGRGAFAVDSRAGLWHTFFALEENTVLLEVKPGPYDPGTDKDFAPWAPEENEDGAPRYLMSLEDRLRSVCRLPPRLWGS